MNIKILFIVAACVVFILPSLAEGGTHQRDSWYIGFGIGTGFDEAWELNGHDVSFDDWFGSADQGPKLALNFKAGATLSPRTLLGFDLTALGQSGTLGGVDGHVQINNYFLMLTHFPREEGFFIRAGGGLSSLVIMVDGGYFSGDETVSGVGLLGGIGYAFWLGKSFNLTVNLDHSRQFYSSGAGEPDKSRFTILYLGFDWY